MNTQTQDLKADVERLELEARKRKLERAAAREAAVRSAAQSSADIARQSAAVGARVAKAARGPTKAATSFIGWVLAVVVVHFIVAIIGGITDPLDLGGHWTVRAGRYLVFGLIATPVFFAGYANKGRKLPWPIAVVLFVAWLVGAWALYLHKAGYPGM